MRLMHFLAAIDFSEAALHALRYAVEEARLHQAKLTLLHVIPQRAVTDVYYTSGLPEPPRPTSLDPVFDARLGPDSRSEPTAARNDPDENALDRLRDLMTDSLPSVWEAEVARGQPADAIVRFAEERNVDLIVMGTHGRTGLRHAFLGSVAEKVIRHAPCPVLAVRHSRGPTA